MSLETETEALQRVLLGAMNRLSAAEDAAHAAEAKLVQSEARLDDRTSLLGEILALAKARWDRAAAASRAASTGTALTVSIEKIRELQYAMGRGEEAHEAFKEIQTLCRKAGVDAP